MNTITIFLSDGQILRHDEIGTTPVLQRKYAIGKTMKNSGQSIEALTIEN